MANYLADKSYLAVKPQSAAATPVIPNVFIPLIAGKLEVSQGYEADRRMKGLAWKSDDLLKGPRTLQGDLEFYADPTSTAHALNMCFAKGSSTGDSDGYTHPFTIGEGKSYSIEISKGVFAERFYGVRGESLKTSNDNNKIKFTLAVKGLGHFSTRSLAVALTGAGMTSAELSQAYDVRPTDGLVVGDVIRIGSVDVTLTSVNANGRTFGFTSTSITASVGEEVALLAQTPSYSSDEIFYMGNTRVGFGVDESAATTAAASNSTATPCYDLAVTFGNNLFAAPASGYAGPAVILNQVREAQVELGRLFETPAEMRKYFETEAKAATLISTGRFVSSAQTSSNSLTMKFPKIKLMKNEEPLTVGEYIFDRQAFEALYNASAAHAVTVALVNGNSGSAY